MASHAVSANSDTRWSPQARAWCAYDFGNSAYAVLFPSVFATYFTGHVVGGTQGSAWLGVLIAVSMTLVALTAPILGGIADASGRRKRLWLAFTAIAISCVLLFSLVKPGMAIFGFAVALVANYAYEAAAVFYNAYLPTLTTRDRLGRLSARGFSVGYVGSLLALAIAAPLASNGWLTWIWIALALQWGLAAIPMIRHMPADNPQAGHAMRAGLRGMRETWATLRHVWRVPDLRRFLLAYFCYMDGVTTAVHFAAVYAAHTLGFSMTENVILLALVQVTALLGAHVAAYPTDHYGPRPVLRCLLLWWLVVVVGAYFATTKPVFFLVSALAGLGLGAIQASSRAEMARLTPMGKEAEYFGLYALCGRSGSVAGPLLFGGISAWAGSQRPAVLAVSIFFLLGLWILPRHASSP